MIAADLDPRLALVPMPVLLAWLAEDVQPPAPPSAAAPRPLPQPLPLPLPSDVASPQRWNLSGDWTMPRREGVLRRPGFTVSPNLSTYAAKRWDFSQPDGSPAAPVEPTLGDATPPGVPKPDHENDAAELPTMAIPVSRLPPRPDPQLPPPHPGATHEAPSIITPTWPRSRTAWLTPAGEAGPALLAPSPPVAKTAPESPPTRVRQTGLLPPLDHLANRSFLISAFGLVVLAGLAAVLLH